MALVFNKIMPKVSVIIPAYNVEKYIGRAIESLINQSFKDIEIIVVNDGSTDKSLDIISSYDDSRICLYNQENKGGAAARNLGIDKASGEYIMFLDADDYYDVKCIKKAYSKITLENTDICIFGSRHIDLRGNVVKDVIPVRNDVVYIENNKEVFLEIENCPWDKIYKTSILKDKGIKFPEGLYYEDLAFTFCLLSNIKTISFVNDVLITYLVGRSGNATNEISKRVFDIFDITDLIVDEYKRNNIYNLYYDEIKAISIINIIDKLKQVILSNDKIIKDEYINKCYDFIKHRFENFKSVYNISKHSHDFVYFNKGILKVYMILKGIKQ